MNTLFAQRSQQLQRQQQYPSSPRAGSSGAGIPQREGNALIALARLVEEITRPDVLRISQDDFEIRVARKDDFAMSCSFFEGMAQGTNTPYGTEVCSWDGSSLVSYLVLPDGLQISHRFTMSPTAPTFVLSQRQHQARHARHLRCIATTSSLKRRPRRSTASRRSA